MVLEEFRTESLVWDRANKVPVSDIFLSQGDVNGRIIEVLVLNRGEVEDLTGMTLKLFVGDLRTSQPLTFTPSDPKNGVFQLTLNDNVSELTGKQPSALQLNMGGQIIESLRFHIHISETTIMRAAATNTDSWTSLETAMMTVARYDTRIAALEAGGGSGGGGDSTLLPRVNQIDTTVQQHGVRITSLENSGGSGGGADMGEVEELINSAVEKVNLKIGLSPDDFDGTDAQKIQRAFNYAVEHEIKDIYLRRKYDITGATLLLTEGEFWDTISFHGGQIIKNDPGFMWDSLGDDNGRQAPHFNHTIFTTSADGVYVFNGDRCIRQIFDTCKFEKVGALLCEDRYIQTLRLWNCETGNLGCDFVKAPNAYDVESIGGRYEQNWNNYYLFNVVREEEANIAFFGFRIYGGVIEGYVNQAPLRLGCGYGLTIDSVYMEYNHGNIIIDRGPMGIGLITGNISNCPMSRNSATYDVEFKGTINLAYFYMMGNTTDVPEGKFFSNRYFNNGTTHDTNNAYSTGVLYPGWDWPEDEDYQSQIDAVDAKIDTRIDNDVLPRVTTLESRSDIMWQYHGGAYNQNETHPQGVLEFWVGTQAQYDAIDPKDAHMIYLITK